MVERLLIGSIVGALVLTGALPSVASAQSARQYCEEMYPIESYEADERSQYIDECIAVTADEYAEPQDGGYYDGTIDDYVESLPADNSAPSDDNAADASGYDDEQYESYNQYE